MDNSAGSWPVVGQGLIIALIQRARVALTHDNVLKYKILSLADGALGWNIVSVDRPEKLYSGQE